MREWLRPKWGWLRWVCLIVLAAVAASVGGRVAAKGREDFDWTAAWVAATAIGTLVLAIVTWTLAYDTKRDVELTLKDQRARDRPTVVVASMNVTPSETIRPGGGTQLRIDAAVHNIGLGPALGLRAYLHCRINGVTCEYDPFPASLAFIRPNDAYSIGFHVTLRGARAEDPAKLGPDDFVISGNYDDRTSWERAGQDYALIDVTRSNNLPSD